MSENGLNRDIEHTPFPWHFDGREVTTQNGMPIAVTTIPEDGMAIADMSHEIERLRGIIRSLADDEAEASCYNSGHSAKYELGKTWQRINQAILSIDRETRLDSW